MVTGEELIAYIAEHYEPRGYIEQGCDMRETFARVQLAPSFGPTCRCCSPEDYGPCTCVADCGSIRCTGWNQ